MAAFIDVFERHEKKYRISDEQYVGLMAALAGRMSGDEYGMTLVCSLYFDTPESHLIEHSLEKPLYKEKLRIRSYGLVGEEDRVFIEIKKKFKGVVYKRRVACSLAAARAFIAGMPFDEATSRYPVSVPSDVVGQNAACLCPATKPSATSLQIANEIDCLQQRYFMLEPAMFISTVREAYVACDDSALRITFDSDIRWRDHKVGFEYGIGGTLLLAPDERILEIKSVGPMPLWIVHELSTLKIFPTSFSKYGEAYRRSSALARHVPTYAMLHKQSQLQTQKGTDEISWTQSLQAC